jgi:hypothetical protein
MEMSKGGDCSTVGWSRFFAFYSCTNVAAQLRKIYSDRSLDPSYRRPLNSSSRRRHATALSSSLPPLSPVSSFIPSHVALPPRGTPIYHDGDVMYVFLHSSQLEGRRAAAFLLPGAEPGRARTSILEAARRELFRSRTWYGTGSCRSCTGSVAAVRGEHDHGPLYCRQRVYVQGRHGYAGGTRSAPPDCVNRDHEPGAFKVFKGQGASLQAVS